MYKIDVCDIFLYLSVAWNKKPFKRSTECYICVGRP